MDVLGRYVSFLSVQTWVPMRRELMRLDTGWLLLVAALVSILILWLQVSLHSAVSICCLSS